MLSSELSKFPQEDITLEKIQNIADETEVVKKEIAYVSYVLLQTGT